ncbi:Myb-like DNA-binding domain containing protein [Trichomonas vaginalis G3]|uniref:Myb-like DNA-binding domain containing protein n=1 Tax=Trichomonas vaginalis (strain ATCC PRA-98 / G3) TaxID=412133 RepID=A2FTB0_TRIV3|nr:MYB protein-related family [Trichomonas vaginalis G3]EAX91862.1 Myb-like DNA-binding domain containing protein [Trichomonas vaginalis G3]KAI5506383.1 MYB protein-related family [Trichomonas vaginalis G3]|eukprot:XP_001304792.1 Myb-like DNA-binding domain containing protein [Trichomonas vaginalis G3]
MIDVSTDMSAIEGIRYLIPKRPFTRIIFSRAEDNRLMELWKRYPNKWNEISEKMGKRSPTICKNRVRYLLDRDHTTWTADNDRLLIELVRKFDTNFRIIQKFFPNHTENFLKNRWEQNIKYKVVDNYVKELLTISANLMSDSDSVYDTLGFDESDESEFYSDFDYYSDFSDYYSEANASEPENEKLLGRSGVSLRI